MILKKYLKYLIAVTLVFSCVSLVTKADFFLDNSPSTFGGHQGGGSRTAWNGVDAIELTTDGVNAGNGHWYSGIKDSGSNGTRWNSLSWVTKAPVKKELPDNNQSETIYAEGNADMTNNSLLMHLNETSGNILDTSGNNNTGNIVGSFWQNGTSPWINYGNKVSVNSSASLNPRNQVAVSIWFVQTNSVGNTGSPVYILNKNNQYAIRLNPVTSFFEFGITTTSGTVWVSSTTQPLNWVNYNLAGLYDGSSVKFYINGTLESSISFSGNIVSSNAPLEFGNFGQSNGAAFILDELSIYKRVLTATEVKNSFLRWATNLTLDVKTCSDYNCNSSPNFVGPDGTTSTKYTDNSTPNTLPTFTLTNLPAGRYFQYHIIFWLDDIKKTPGFSPKLAEVNTNYSLYPPLSLAIRSIDDTSNINSCNLGTVSTSAVSSCSYNLKVGSTSSNGYVVSIQTSGGLSNGTSNVVDADAGNSGSGGSLINSTTTGVEKYGIFVNPGTITSGNAVSKKPLFDGGANSVSSNYTSPTNIVESFGENMPNTVSPANNIIITHNLNISSSTPAGSYNQSVIYTVTPKI